MSNRCNMLNLTNTNPKFLVLSCTFLYWSLGFSRQEYWNGLSFPSPGDLPNPGIEPRAPTLQVDSIPAELQEKP